MRRRDVLPCVVAAALAWPRAGLAQGGPVVGFLSSRSAQESTHLLAAFRSGLRESGVLGQQATIEERWANGRFDQLPALAAGLVERRVAVLVSVGNTVSAHAAQAASRTTPIVFVVGDDPVKAGLVAQLHQPSGNVTGVAVLGTMLEAKRLELLTELVPQARTAGLLLNSGSPGRQQMAKEMQATADALGRQLVIVQVAAASEFAAAFGALAAQRADALVVAADPLFTLARAQVTALAEQHAIPAIYQWREFAEAGGLISYGTNLASAYRSAGNYAGRILNGASPSSLPVLQPTTFELVINLKTAGKLGLTVPPSLIARADEVIE